MRAARFAVLGAAGQLGRRFVTELGTGATGLTRRDLDFTATVALARKLEALAPAVVVNAAAYNDVDGAEREPGAAWAANAALPAALAKLSEEQGWKLLHFSTDYVYGGDGVERARVETDPPAPINAYGRSKWEGEQAVLAGSPRALVARVANLYGGPPPSPARASLVLRFLQRAGQGRPIEVVPGLRVTPTSVCELARTSLALLAADARGLFHLAGEGDCTLAEFAREIVRLAAVRAEVVERAGPERAARRALNTTLENRRLRRELGWTMRGWREAVADYVATLVQSPPRESAP